MVTQRKKSIKKRLSAIDFNWYAFIFNSIYYLIKGLPVWFCIYAIVPWVLFFAASLVFDQQTLWLWAICGGCILAVHLVSGFLANRHLKEYNKAIKQVDFDASTEYLVISGKRLFWLMLLSGGWYIYYWMYKNWRAIKQATKERIFPICRSYLFPILFIGSMLLRIKKSAVKYNGINKSFTVCSILIIVLWLIGAIFEIVLSRLDWSMLTRLDLATICIIGFVLTLLTTPLFLPIQRTINAYNAKEFPERGLKQKLTWGEYAIVSLGFFLEYGIYAFNIYTAAPTQPFMPNLSKLPQNQQEAIIQAVGHAYSNIHGYEIVCAQSGYELKSYPEEFKKSMDSELDGLEQILMRDNVSLEETFGFFIRDDVLKQIHEKLYNELKIIAAADDDGVASACQLLDEDAADIAQNVADEMRPFYYETLSPLFQN